MNRFVDLKRLGLPLGILAILSLTFWAWRLTETSATPSEARGTNVGRLHVQKDLVSAAEPIIPVIAWNQSAGSANREGSNLAPSFPTTVSYYRLRLKCESTSDWTSLELKNPGAILTWKQIAVEGAAGS